jgi:hypothetical protein
MGFAGTSYRVGRRYREEHVEVRVVGDTVQMCAAGTGT